MKLLDSMFISVNCNSNFQWNVTVCEISRYLLVWLTPEYSREGAGEQMPYCLENVIYINIFPFLCEMCEDLWFQSTCYLGSVHFWLEKENIKEYVINCT